MAAGKGALTWVCLGRNPECREAWVAHGAPPALKNPSISNGLYRRRSDAGSLLVVKLPPARRSGSVAGVTGACVCDGSGVKWPRVG